MRGFFAGLALLVVWAAPARADFASEALLHDFIRSIDASADWSASARLVRSEGDSTLAEGLVFSRQDPAVTVDIERLRLSRLIESEGGGFTAAEIELTGGALAAEGVEYSVPTARVGDLEWPNTEGLVFDPHHMMTFIARLYSLMADAEFADFSMPEMTVSITTPPGGGEGGPSGGVVTYKNVTSEALRSGVLGGSQAGPISFALQSPDGEVRFEVQSVSAERMDFGALAHILDATHYRDGRGDGIWRPLISSVGYSGFSGTGPDGATFRLTDIAIENVDGRQADKPFTALWDRILDPTVPEEAKSDLALEALREIYSAWRLGTFRMDGFAFDVPKDNVKASLDAFTVTGLSNQGIDSVILKQFRASGPQGFGALDSLELAGFVFPDAEALMQFAALENDASADKHEDAMLAAFAALPRLSHFGMRGLAGGKSDAEAVRIDLVSLDLRNWNDIFAGETDISIEGVAIPTNLLQLDPSQQQVMDTLGFDQLVLGMSLADRWSPDTGVDDATWKLTLRDGADIELTYRLSGVTTEWMLAATAAGGKTEDSTAATMAMLEGLRLDRARLSVTDRSLLDRGFAVAAQMQGLSTEGAAYRKQMRDALPFLLSAALPGELSKLISAPLQAFMAGGQTLVAEIAPAMPVPVLELAVGAEDPMALVNRLGVTLRSEAPAQ